MTTLQQRVVAVARPLVGIMEHGSNNHGASVERIIRANGGVPGEAWCGDFVAYCYLLAGCKTVTRPWASVSRLPWVNGNRIVSRPRAGDIVCYTFDHTGIVLTYCDANGVPAVVRKATHIKTIEGNTGRTGSLSDSANGGDGVRVKVRPLSEVSHFVRVAGR